MWLHVPWWMWHYHMTTVEIGSLLLLCESLESNSVVTLGDKLLYMLSPDIIFQTNNLAQSYLVVLLSVFNKHKFRLSCQTRKSYNCKLFTISMVQYCVGYTHTQKMIANLKSSISILTAVFVCEPTRSCSQSARWSWRESAERERRWQAWWLLLSAFCLCLTPNLRILHSAKAISFWD